MPTDGDDTAVLDRCEDDLAMALLERDGEAVDDITVPRADLPESARYQDAVLLSVKDGAVQQAIYKTKETDQRAERVRSSDIVVAVMEKEGEREREKNHKVNRSRLALCNSHISITDERYIR